jgi:hypothetical protein
VAKPNTVIAIMFCRGKSWLRLDFTARAIPKEYTAAALVQTRLNVSGLNPWSPYLAVTKFVDRRITPPRE